MQQIKEERVQSFCLESGHETFYASLLCTFIKCDQKSRLVCALCFYWKFHEHGQQDTSHIIDTEITKMSKIIKELAYQKIMQVMEDFQTKVNQKLQEFQNQAISNSQYNKNKLNMMFIKDDILQKIDMLKKILNSSDTDLEQSPYQYLNRIDLVNIDFNNQQSKEDNNLITKYNTKEFQVFHHFNQEMLLLFCQNDLVRIQSTNLKVYNIHNNQLKNTINKKIYRKITCLSFNYDNTILFFVDYVGYVYGCDINKDYDIIFKRKIHSNQIEHIYSIYDEIITIDQHKTIKITNIRNGKQIVKIEQFKLNDSLAVVGYDFVGGNIILECGNQVKIQNRFKHKVILNHNNVGRLIKGQFVQPNYLLVLTRNNFKQFEISYQQGQVSEIKSFEGYSFESFSSVEYGNKFILISKGKIFILDQNLELILQFRFFLYHAKMPNNIKIYYIHCMEQIVIVKEGVTLIFQSILCDNKNMQKLQEKSIYPRKYIPICK